MKYRTTNLFKRYIQKETNIRNWIEDYEKEYGVGSGVEITKKMKNLFLHCSDNRKYAISNDFCQNMIDFWKIISGYSSVEKNII